MVVRNPNAAPATVIEIRTAINATVCTHGKVVVRKVVIPLSLVSPETGLK
jgi:hypothetical protein